MINSRPSVTAERVAVRRAMHQVIAFDYSIPPDTLTPRQRARFDAFAARAAAAGEPWRTFFEPLPLDTMLRQLGFSDVQDIDADELNRRYFAGRADGLRIDGVGRFGHIARADV